MQIPIDLRQYGVKKIISAMDVSEIDLDGVDVDLGKFVVTIVLHGSTVTVDAKSLSGVEHIISVIGNGMIKL